MPKRPLVFTLLLGSIILLSAENLSSASRAQTPTSSLLFIENAGQFDPRARFLVEGNGVTIWITDDGLWLTMLDRDQHPARPTLPDPTGQDVESHTTDTPPRAVNLHLTFPDNAVPTLEPFGRQATVVSYFTPQGQFVGVPVWGGVRYVGLYPGLDLEITSRDGYWTMQFVATSDTAPAEIPLQIEGANALRLENGLPVASTPLGDIPFPLHSTTNITVHAAAKETTASFPLHPSPFIPHPSSLIPSATNGLVYSTYLGGNADDQPNTIAVNALGEIYVAGETYSLAFPSGPGLNVPTHLVAAFIAKMNSTGTALEYVVNIISAGLTENVIKDIVVDSAGNAYVTGFTDSADFPTTLCAFDTIPPAASLLYKAFAMKINSTGGVVYSTLLGTNTASELGNGIAVDSAGNAYITGYTESANFPLTVDAYDRTLDGTRDVFVTKLNATGTWLVYSTLIGGNSKDTGERIALDSSNNVIISGTSEDGPTYPQTVAPIGPTGTWDIVVSKLNAGGTGLLYSAIIGGSSYDYFPAGLALDPLGNAFITGYTYSGDFPTTAGAYDVTLNGTVDPVVFKLYSGGSALDFSTYLGGSSPSIYEFSYDLALDSNNHPYVVGYTDSPDFPTTVNSYSSSLFGPYDFFIAKLNGTGTQLDYGTYFGGSLDDFGTAIAVRAPYEFIVTGSTISANFPTTPGAYDLIPNGGVDGGIATFDLSGFLSGFAENFLSKPVTPAETPFSEHNSLDWMNSTSESPQACFTAKFYLPLVLR